MKMKKQKWEENQLYEYFKRQRRKMLFRRPKLVYERETENIFKAVKNNAIRTNYINATTDNTY